MMKSDAHQRADGDPPTDTDYRDGGQYGQRAGDDYMTDPSGNSGGRIACGVLTQG